MSLTVIDNEDGARIRIHRVGPTETTIVAAGLGIAALAAYFHVYLSGVALFA